jgi:hypothetical protein
VADGRAFRRLTAGLCIGLAAALFAGSAAHADPAGPTDYESVIVGVEPPTPSVHPSIVGGDSFVQLRVDAGTDVVVLGYEGEDYLWFRADGVVLENRNSPSAYLNDDRFATAEVPATADADATPDWTEVATGGEWVWHDHRAHWMQSTPPVGQGPGDQILDAEIPMRVDGQAVGVRVVSTWLPDPSPAAAVLGAIAGLAFAVAAWGLRGFRLPAVLAALPVAVAAATIGAWQYVSLPAATGPRLVWLVLPAIAVVCAVVGAVLGRRSTFVADAALLVVGAELAIWGFVKRDGLGAAIVPTDAPQWADRLVTAMSLVGGVAFVGLAIWWLFAATSSGPRRAQRVQGADGLAAPGPPVSTS